MLKSHAAGLFARRMLIVQPRHIGGLVEGILGGAEGGRALQAVMQAADSYDAFAWRQSIGGFLSAPGLCDSL